MNFPLNGLLLGAIVTASITVALFFLHFWRSTGDRFFLFFALSFFIDGIARLLIGAQTLSSEDWPLYYLIRLVAYALILYAIIDKNRPAGSGD
jgi:uncharacterized membrane protein HdeD (DUF308 family)